MINSVQQEQKCAEQKSSVSLSAALMGAVSNKYFVISLLSVVLAGIAYFLGSEDVSCLADVSAAALLGLLLWVVQYIWLRKYGISRKMILENSASVDPRLAGSLGDLNSLGSTMGALAGISVVLSELFIINGGALNSGEVVLPIMENIAKAVCIGSMISVTTSRPSLRCSLYIITGRSTGARGSELLKKTCRASRSEGLMTRIQKMSYLRIAGAVVTALVIVMSALSGAGSAFTCAGTAFLCMLAVGLSGCCAKGKDEKLSDEKLPLFDKEGRKKCTQNCVFFMIISFLFMYTLPFRSVYTEYTLRQDYFYDDVVTERFEIFSIPAPGDESAALMNGLFITSALMIIVISGVYALSSGFMSVSQISSELIGAAISFGAAACYGAINKAAALDPIQYLVAASIACLLIVLNMIAYLIEKRRLKKQSE
ncbi:MAG: hypothetical protein MSJ26_08050 [Oscillospiraceae bacterium]|nr:hypothetical protein [Oscillospiraceae bacterium]